MNYKDEFKTWVSNNLTKDSGAVSAYITSLDWLSEKFYENGKIKELSIFDIDDSELITQLHEETKALQRNKDSYIYNIKAPSYGDRYFYSASLGKYQEFLISKKGILKTVKPIAVPAIEKFKHSKFHSDSKSNGLIFSDSIVTRFISSLLTKPFVILTGLSGSGKTKLAQSFAMWICENENQYCIAPVGADWTNREPLLGFPNSLETGKYLKPDNGVLDLIIAANNNTTKPYFLILDEMNLSHVERYFADFLSVMETRSYIPLHSGNKDFDCAGIKIPSQMQLPKNLFIIGTVNIDETTYMFSPKVLDRANVIEFRVNKLEMENFLKNDSKLQLENIVSNGANMADNFVEISKNEKLAYKNSLELNNALITFFVELKKTGAEFGYRSANEIKRFVGVVNTIEPNWNASEIIDAAIMQKLLPKVHGSRRKLEPVLKTLTKLCIVNELNIEDFILPKNEIDFSDNTKIKYPLSLEKILRMYNGLIDNGFTSYAEA